MGTSIVGVLTPRQIRWLRKHLNDYHRRVARALEDDVYDPVVSAILEARRAGDQREVRACLVDTLLAVTASLESLPSQGGVVEPEDDEARWRWVWALHELRMALTVRLGRKIHSDASAKLMNRQSITKRRSRTKNRGMRTLTA
ncbi:hypothetical protein [Amycolatopsis sp. NPDC058986]|uniref:hypothetical protein n=1 Tax=unclassified Amycolatopsis TaxID=2618356 RepID=UPI00366E6E5C